MLQKKWASIIIILALGTSLVDSQETVKIPDWQIPIGLRVTSLEMLDKAFVVAYNNTISKIDFKGSILWNYSINTTINTLKADEEGIILSAMDGRIYSILEGFMMWDKDLEEQSLFPDSVDMNADRIIIGTSTGNVYCINRNGNPLWEYNSGGYSISATIIGNETIIITDRDVIRLDQDGKQIKKFGVEDRI